jgi:hypothetical protein
VDDGQGSSQTLRDPALLLASAIGILVAVHVCLLIRAAKRAFHNIEAVEGTSPVSSWKPGHLYCMLIIIALVAFVYLIAGAWSVCLAFRAFR